MVNMYYQTCFGAKLDRNNLHGQRFEWQRSFFITWKKLSITMCSDDNYGVTYEHMIICTSIMILLQIWISMQ